MLTRQPDSNPNQRVPVSTKFLRIVSCQAFSCSPLRIPALTETVTCFDARTPRTLKCKGLGHKKGVSGHPVNHKSLQRLSAHPQAPNPGSSLKALNTTLKALAFAKVWDGLIYR